MGTTWGTTWAANAWGANTWADAEEQIDAGVKRCLSGSDDTRRALSGSDDTRRALTGSDQNC